MNSSTEMNSDNKFWCHHFNIIITHKTKFT